MLFAHRLAGAAAFAVALATASASAVASDGRAALDRIPKDYALVMSINVDRAKSSPLFKDVWAMAAKNPEMQKNLDMLKAQANFDFSRDVKTVVVGINGATANGGDPQMVLLVEGKFDQKKIAAFARSQGKGVTEQTYAGQAYLDIDAGSLCVMGGYMVMTPKSAMKTAIDVKQGKIDSVKKNAAFMKMLGATDLTKDFWFVGLLPAQAATMLKASLGHGVDALGASIDVASGLKSKVQVSTESAASAKALADLIKMQIATIAKEPQLQAMGLAAAVGRVNVSNSDKMLNVAFDLTTPELTTIKNMLKMFLPQP